MFAASVPYGLATFWKLFSEPSMPQPIAGVTPPEDHEVTIMTQWPSVAATAWGRWWGRRYANNAGLDLTLGMLSIGRIVAAASIPLILPVYFHMVVPRLPGIVFGWPNPSCRRYRLTNRRVIVEQPFGGGEQRSVALDRFDEIEVVVQPGQQWYRAGDLVFRSGPIETFRLAGVPSPESFRHTCMKAHQGYVGVQNACAMGVAS